PHYHHPVGPFPLADLFKCDHDTSGLLGVASGADSQVDIRLRDGEILEKTVGHFGVVVLAGMDQADLQIPSGLLPAPQSLHNGRNFHEIRTGTGHEEDFHKVNSYLRWKENCTERQYRRNTLGAS